MTEQPAPSAFDESDPLYQSAVVDLLGAMAYGELEAFARLTADSAMTPDYNCRVAIADMAVAEYGHFKKLLSRLVELGAQPDEAMAPFIDAIDGFHELTAPNDWLEGLVKAYVGDGIAMDFYRSVAAYLDAQTRELVEEVCSDLGHSAFVIETVRAAIDADPVVAGRLALWGRRLMGEAVAQSQRVAAQREGLVELVLGGSGGPDMGDIMRMFAELTDRHTQRMKSLGLDS